MKELNYPFDKEYLLNKRRRIKKELLQTGCFIKIKIAILGGSTTANIKDMLELFLLNNGIEPEFYESEYNRYYEDAVFSNAELDAFKPHIVYICTSVRNIVNWPLAGINTDEANNLVESECSKLRYIWEALYKRFKCVIIQNNFDMPPYRLLGNYDAADPSGAVRFVCSLNSRIGEEVFERSYLNLIDLNYISSDYGLKMWHDEVAWCSYKYAMNPDAVPELAYNVANVIKAIYGRNKKALVLDMDNTLWGGVIGDDGAENIVLGPDTPLGQAYSHFQEYIKKHASIGVLLAVNSKNDPDNACSGLNHPDSILRKDDFVCIKANWNNKDENIRQIAEELSLGADSFVFVDDNPSERMLVSDNVSGIAVPDMETVTDYTRILDRSGFFETVGISTDDIKRNSMYKENAARQTLELSYTDYGDYLNALEMKAVIRPFEAVYLQRISQLTNKSNQFNLTTRRYTLEQIEDVTDSDNYITLYGRLSDRFGDNGVVSVVIGKIENNTCHIDLWLMSCRVLKRKLEHAMMDELVAQCIKRDISIVTGTYIPTTRNKMVQDFYKDMGFEFVSEESDVTTWKLAVGSLTEKKNKYITIGGLDEQR